MTPTATRPPSNGAATLKLADQARAKKLPDRIILYAPEKWGKTTFAAQFPDPLFLMTKGEDGLKTLIHSGQLPWVNHFEETVEHWTQLKTLLGDIREQNLACRTLVMDTLNGGERLCHEYVCRTKFDGDWGEKGFTAFQRGYDVSVPEWLELLELLDGIRARGKTILCLAHRGVRNFKNPSGPDYDHFGPELHPKTWSATHKWADMILRGDFETFIETGKRDTDKKKGKATGGKTRLLFTEGEAAFIAGNRHGLPPEIELGASPQAAFAAFKAAFPKKGG